MLFRYTEIAAYSYIVFKLKGFVYQYWSSTSYINRIGLNKIHMLCPLFYDVYIFWSYCMYPFFQMIGFVALFPQR